MRFALVLAFVVSLALTPAAAGVVAKGKIVPNRGAAGVRLGMTKAQVVARLGRPIFKNAFGYMEYGKDPNLFDVYLDTSTSPARVRLIGISGPRFCLAGGGPCMLAKGGVRKLEQRYGQALRLVRLETLERVYRLKDAYRGCKVFTDFTPTKPKPRGRIIMTFIGFKSGSAC